MHAEEKRVEWGRVCAFCISRKLAVRDTFYRVKHPTNPSIWLCQNQWEIIRTLSRSSGYVFIPACRQWLANLLHALQNPGPQDQDCHCSVYFRSLLTSPYLAFVSTAAVVAVVAVAVAVPVGLLPAQSHSARSQHYIQNASLALPVLHCRAIPNNYVSMQLCD